MRVVFLEDVAGVANGGEVKEVKNGFARNYLIPKNLAVPASHNAMQRVERLKRHSDVTRVKLLTDMRELAEELDGVQVQVEMRAGSGGRLYGSVTNAIVAEQLAEVTGREIDRRLVEIPDPIRQLGKFEVAIRLHPEVQAAISVLVYASGTDPTMLDEEEDEETEDGEPEVEIAPSVEMDGAATEDIEVSAPADSAATDTIEDATLAVEEIEDSALADSAATDTMDGTATEVEGETTEDTEKSP